jgi:hypothetical protein
VPRQLAACSQACHSRKFVRHAISRGLRVPLDQTVLVVLNHADQFSRLRPTSASFLRHMDQWPPTGSSGLIDLSGPQTIITGATALQTLVTLYTEQKWAGRVLYRGAGELGKETCLAVEVDGQARWERDRPPTT